MGRRVAACAVLACALAQRDHRFASARLEGAVTLSITTTVGEEIGVAARAIVGALNSTLVRVRRAVVDADPARPAAPSAARAFEAQVAGLLRERALTEVARVDYSAAYTSGNASVFFKLFGRASGPLRNRRGRGFLAYLFEIETCETPFLLHADSDTRVYNRGLRDPVADLVGLVSAWPDVLAAALPLHLGTDNCTLDPRDTEVLRRGVSRDARGFVDLGDVSTQFYLLSLRKLKRQLPLPFKRANVEDCLSALRRGGETVVAAMIPHARPPAYFRGQGKRFLRDVRRAADDVRTNHDARPCGPPPPGSPPRRRRRGRPPAVR